MSMRNRRVARRSLAVVVVCGLSLVSPAEPAEEPDTAAKTPLIPRRIFFGNPDRSSAALSPDGKQISFLAAVDGVLNVWVGPADRPDQARPVTQDTHRGIRMYLWAYTSEHLLYIQDQGGDENWRVYAVNLKTNRVTDLTPFPGVQARVERVSHKFPAEVLLATNDRQPEFHDVYRVNIETGERKLVYQNDEFAEFTTDVDFNLRFGTKFTPEGGTEIFQRVGQEWKQFAKVGAEDVLTTSPAGVDKTGQTLFLIDSRGRNTSALTAIDLKSGQSRVLAENPRADVARVVTHPVEQHVEAVAFNYEREEWQILDEKLKPDFDYLKTVADGELDVTSRTLDDQHWIVSYMVDNGPVRYYRYDRGARRATLLFTNRKALEGLPLARMHALSIKSRDGFDLVSYLTLPGATAAASAARPAQPVPMVLLVHGGPWARDEWGYNPYHQWLANRGYAVLSVNFRGSTGLGKNFSNAGDLEWAGRMHDDLIDAVEWAVREKIADRARIAIMGGSYGGYATLVGLTFTPEVFACGIDIVGPSNLVTLLNSVPPYWKPMLDMLIARVGDNRTEEGRAYLTERSPLTYVDRIRRPLLIGQGANDPRVKQAESDQIVQAMQAKNIPVTYVLFPDEGHGFQRPENNLAFNAVTESFLAQHLGGRFEPVGEDFTGASIQIPAGAQQVPGVAETLPKPG